MTLLSIALIDSSIEKTKKFLFPIDKILWLKLGIVSLLAGIGFSNANVNLWNDVPQSSDVISTVTSAPYLIAGIIAAVLIVFLLFSIVRTVFNFVLLDAVEKKYCLIKKSLRENISLALSYFFLIFIVNFFFLLLTLAVAIPMLKEIFLNADSILSIFLSTSFWLSTLAAIIVLIIAGIINAIIINLVMPDMYLQRITSFNSWKRVYKLFLREIKEVIVYWIMKFLLGIVASIIGIGVMFLLLIPVVILGILLFGIGFLIVSISKALLLPLIISGIMLAIVLVFVAIYAMAVILVPIPVFFTNYKLDFYKELMKKHKELSSL